MRFDGTGGSIEKREAIERSIQAVEGGDDMSRLTIKFDCDGFERIPEGA